MKKITNSKFYDEYYNKHITKYIIEDECKCNFCKNKLLFCIDKPDASFFYRGPSGIKGDNGISFLADPFDIPFTNYENNKMDRLNKNFKLDDIQQEGRKILRGSFNLPGPTGPIGQHGLRGLPGPTGPIGQHGLRGLPGPTGSIGQQGLRGLPGPTGSIGQQGLRGLSGPTGSIGQRGLPGPTGSMGQQGLRGLQGPTGSMGQQGLRGLPGPTGSIGEKGKKGERGLIGPTGPAGQSGIRGLIGPTGPAGQHGRQGDKGEKGDRGLVGPTGLAGRKGEKGKKGLIGPTGPIGRQGIKGKDGKRGLRGPTGPAGQLGPRGFKGQKGRSGVIRKCITVNCDYTIVNEDMIFVNLSKDIIITLPNIEESKYKCITIKSIINNDLENLFTEESPRLIIQSQSNQKIEKDKKQIELLGFEDCTLCNDGQSWYRINQGSFKSLTDKYNENENLICITGETITSTTLPYYRTIESKKINLSSEGKMMLEIKENGIYFIEFSGEGMIQGNPLGIGYYQLFKNDEKIEDSLRSLGQISEEINSLGIDLGVYYSLNTCTKLELLKGDIIYVKFKYNNNDESDLKLAGNFKVGRRNLVLIKAKKK